MSHNLVSEMKKMMTHSKIGTPITFRREKLSIVTNCAYSVPTTNEPLQYVHLSPIPVW